VVCKMLILKGREKLAARSSLPQYMLGVKAGEATVLMFTVELTRGPGRDAPALAVWETVDRYLGNAEKFARLWLKAYQREHPESGASGYRILDQHGNCLKASAL
jgi:hypothetical protein